MALHSTEAPAAIDMTQPLPLAPLLGEMGQERPAPASSAEVTSEHQTLYVSLDMPSDELFSATAKPEAQPPAAPSNQNAGNAATATNAADLVQIQALELAANRAEIARHQREHDELQRAVRVRDRWLEDLRNELKSSREECKALAAQLREAKSSLEETNKKVAQQQNQIASLEAQIAERMGMTAFAADASRTRPAAHTGQLLDLDKPAKLEPLDDDSPPFVLNRKVMTVGRTRDNDICVPSALVSRDHARFLVSNESVVMFDVGSINGCFVNDQLTRRHTLRNGDVVRFADRSYRFKI